MNARTTFPARGLLATALVIALSLGVSAAMSPATLGGWASLVLVAMVPTQIVYGLLWKNRLPRASTRIAQPARGLLQLSITVAIGACVACGALFFAGGGAPAPFAIMFLILSVPVTFCLVVVWETWPLRLAIQHEGALGLSLLATAYAITATLYRALFNFSFTAHAPFYRFMLDPHGAFMAWLPLSAALDALVFMLLAVLFDFWPVAVLARRFRLLQTQPAFGFTIAVGVALGAGALWLACIGAGGMDVVMFMTRACVCTIFGVFVMLVMLEGLPALKLRQPLRGIVLSILALLIGQGAFALYGLVARQRFHLMPGAPAYDFELWLASSMLSVTFPAMVLFAQYFQFWPLASHADPAAATCRDSASIEA
jgi:hypothetical protein